MIAFVKHIHLILLYHSPLIFYGPLKAEFRLLMCNHRIINQVFPNQSILTCDVKVNAELMQPWRVIDLGEPRTHVFVPRASYQLSYEAAPKGA